MSFTLVVFSNVDMRDCVKPDQLHFKYFLLSVIRSSLALYTSVFLFFLDINIVGQHLIKDVNNNWILS